MHSPLAAVVLCIFATTASWPCLATDAKSDPPVGTVHAVQSIAKQAAEATSVTAADSIAKNAPEPMTIKAAEPHLAPAIKTSAMPAPSSIGAAATTQPRAGGELIKTAAAGTREDAPAGAREAAPMGASAAQGAEQPRRGNTAMLLAALALMSGIALRRFGAPGR